MYQKRLFILIFGLLLLFGVTLYFAQNDIKSLYFKLIQKQEDTLAKNAVKITFLDIGQGDASFIEFPNGEQMLVDCAIDSRILSALGRVMSFRDRTIDYLVVTHPDQDHYGGCVDVLRRYKVNNIIYNGFEKETSSYFPVFIDSVQNEKAQYIEIEQEQTLTVASSTLRFLFPDAPVEDHTLFEKLSQNKISNNTSLVFLLEYGNKKVLFTGDAESETEEYLVNKYGKNLDADVLKVGHHGSHTSSGEEFLKLVTPEIATISAGKDNDYGHPSGRILKRLERIGAKIWRTDEKGDIIVYVYDTHLYAPD